METGTRAHCQMSGRSGCGALDSPWVSTLLNRLSARRKLNTWKVRTSFIFVIWRKHEHEKMRTNGNLSRTGCPKVLVCTCRSESAFHRVWCSTQHGFGAKTEAGQSAAAEHADEPRLTRCTGVRGCRFYGRPSEERFTCDRNHATTQVRTVQGLVFHVSAASCVRDFMRTIRHQCRLFPDRRLQFQIQTFNVHQVQRRNLHLHRNSGCLHH